MEKPCKSSKKKITILKLLPKAAAAAAFILQNAHAPFSPSREKRLEHHHKNHHHKGFTGPIIPVISAHQVSGRKSEPSSPKISCMGQIKHNKKKTLNRMRSSEKTSTSKNQRKNITNKSMSNFVSMFSGKSKLISGRKSDVTIENIVCKLPDRAPCLSQMQRFASGREPLTTNFDWRSIQITPQDRRKYYTDDDREFSDDDDDDDEDDDEEISPFSGPILLGRSRTTICLEPRKEINLWKRRTMVQPKPLQLQY